MFSRRLLGAGCAALFAAAIAACGQPMHNDGGMGDGNDVAMNDVIINADGGDARPDTVIHPDVQDVVNPTDVQDVAVDTGCSGTMQMCGTSCVDTLTDTANCGSCGH